MTIDELSRRTAITSRSIRAYQTAGLLPPPRLEGRVGHYHEGHARRLVTIDRLKRRGFSLAAIRELLAAWEAGRSLGELMGLEGATERASGPEPWPDERFATLPAAMSGWVELEASSLGLAPPSSN